MKVGLSLLDDEVFWFEQGFLKTAYMTGKVLSRRSLGTKINAGTIGMDGFPASVAPEVWAVAWIEQRNVGVLAIRTTGEHDKGVVKRDNYIKNIIYEIVGGTILLHKQPLKNVETSETSEKVER